MTSVRGTHREKAPLDGSDVAGAANAVAAAVEQPFRREPYAAPRPRPGTSRPAAGGPRRRLPKLRECQGSGLARTTRTMPPPRRRQGAKARRTSVCRESAAVPEPSHSCGDPAKFGPAEPPPKRSESGSGQRPWRGKAAGTRQAAARLPGRTSRPGSSGSSSIISAGKPGARMSRPVLSSRRLMMLGDSSREP